MTTVFASKITLVELNEMVDVLTVRKKEVKKLKVNSWVRFKRGKYEGDLGQVIFSFFLFLLFIFILIAIFFIILFLFFIYFNLFLIQFFLNSDCIS